MPALNFVAIEDGLEDHPKLVSLARLLRVDRGRAVWFVLRLRRLILQAGDHLAGSLPRSFTADHICGFLEFEGKTSKLVEALKKEGYLGFKKGRGFYYPGWKETITGRYACRRENDRLWQENRRQERRETVGRPSSDVDRRSLASSSDLGPRSARHLEENNQAIKAEPCPPDAPPDGGDSLADARWAWIFQNAPTAQNRNACKAMLAKMSEEDWALVQRAYGRLSAGGPSISRADMRVLRSPTDVFLRKQSYLRFAEKARPRRSVSNESKPTTVADLAAEIEKLAVDGEKFLLDQLADSEVSDDKKDLLRRRWLSDPSNKGRVPPWDRHARASDHVNGVVGSRPPKPQPIEVPS